MRTCLRCGVCSPESEFAWADKAKGQHRNKCKPCHAAVTREWRIANPDKRKAQKLRYAKRYPEKIRAHGRRTAAKSRAERPEEFRKYQRDWRKTPQGRAATRAWIRTPKGIASNRANALRHIYGKEVMGWWNSLVNPPCTYCGEPATQIDHIVPVSKNGPTELWNLTPACRPCNLRKRDKDLNVFLEEWMVA